MAIGQLLFVMGWSPSAGVTEVGFHLYLGRNREAMCFAKSFCGGDCASNFRQKTTVLRG